MMMPFLIFLIQRNLKDGKESNKGIEVWESDLGLNFGSFTY